MSERYEIREVRLPDLDEPGAISDVLIPYVNGVRVDLGYVIGTDYNSAEGEAIAAAEAFVRSTPEVQAETAARVARAAASQPDFTKIVWMEEGYDWAIASAEFDSRTAAEAIAEQIGSLVRNPKVNLVAVWNSLDRDHVVYLKHRQSSSNQEGAA